MAKNPYEYGKKELVKDPIKPLTEQHKDLLFESKRFCMLPWIHLHAYPTGEAYTCCLSDMKYKVGNTKTQSLEEIWNGESMREIRLNMLNNKPSDACLRCYEQETSGFFSMRLSSNKHFGHNVHFIDDTDHLGRAPMRLTYWDIRFSNLCNLRCRSCGHIFSSNWYDDQAKLYEENTGLAATEKWKKENPRLYFAGRHTNDIYDQLESHIDDLEQVYFAGGEPLIMEEHYRLLKTLLDKNMKHVRLIYNTNFTNITYKKLNVLDLWQHFDSVSVGASLDAMGPHAEYIRKGTLWSDVESNREEMLKKCPKVDFYISPTLSILNAFHLTDFHKTWVDRGFIKAQDLNVNILQDPVYYRIDILSEKYKNQLKEQYMEHIDWLRPQDHLTRATTGFESAVNFMQASDKSDILPQFLARTQQLDKIRDESIVDAIPELKDLLNDIK